MTTLIFLFIGVIIGSALFSGLEASLFAIPQSRVHVLADQKKRGSAALMRIKEKINRPIVTIVIGNNIVNIVGSIAVGAYAAQLFGSLGVGIVSAVLTILIIVFGEIIPKTIGENYCEEISLASAPILEFITKVLNPIVVMLEFITKPFTKIKNIVSEEEIQIMSHIGTLEGTIEEDEREMIHNVFALNDYSAEDLMIPFDEVIAYEGHVSIKSLRKEIMDLTHSTIPIYISGKQDIAGIAYRVTLLRALANDEFDNTPMDYIQEPLVVPAGMRADHLLPLFRQKQTHFAIVRNVESGRHIGIITLEDILEALVGDINDQTDK